MSEYEKFIKNNNKLYKKDIEFEKTETNFDYVTTSYYQKRYLDGLILFNEECVDKYNSEIERLVGIKNDFKRVNFKNNTVIFEED